MKSIVSAFIVGLVASCCSAGYIDPSKEYIYDYYTKVITGSGDYVDFASTFNITGKLRVQKVGGNLMAKLEDLKFEAHNGEYSMKGDFNTVPKAYQQLNPLMEPFNIMLDANNLAKGVVLSGDIPEWARNIHRGIATSLQLDSDRANGQETTFEVDEKTVTGECPTAYQVVKGDEGVEVRKLRTHANCQNRPMKVRAPGTGVKTCTDESTRDTYKSAAQGRYTISKFNDEVTLTRVVAASSIDYRIFGSKGHGQCVWTWSEAALNEVKTAGFRQIGSPSNPQTFDNLRYVFESSMTADDPLETPSPYFFHYAEPITDESTLRAIADKVFEDLLKIADTFETTKVYEDGSDFHKVSPFGVIPSIMVLPYSNLKTLYDRFMQENSYTKTKVFLDSLVVAGTGPAALLIRDIVRTTPDARMIANLMGPLPNYIRNPTEKLLVEYESLLNSDLPKQNLRIIEFSFASLLSRTCKQAEGQWECNSGMVDKYVRYFSDKYEAGATFEEKTAAIYGLRNLGLPASKAKLVSIATDKDVERSVRVTAITGLQTITHKEAIETLLPIFYDRRNHHELRTKAAEIFLLYHYDQTIAQQMVISMWNERCKNVRNFMYTFVDGLAYTTSPCMSLQGSHARSLLNMFPGTEIDRTLSGSYTRDFHDRDFHFGHLTQLSVQKSGDSVLPVTIFGSLKGHIAGYGVSYLSFFVRMEGLGKALADRIMSMSTGQIDFDEVKSVFSKIGVTERTSTPLRIELGLFLHKRMVAYHAADASTVTTIPMLLKKLQEMKSAYEVELSRMFLLGGVMLEQPTEFGTPVSAVSSVMAMANVNIKTTREKSGTSIAQTSDWHIQSALFGVSKLSSHFPAFGTMHSVTALRTFRSRIPRKFKMNLDYKALSFSFAVDTPTEEDPLMLMVHSTAITEIGNDNKFYTNAEAHDLLKASCAGCSPVAIISKGADHRGSRQIGFPEVSRFKIFSGVKRGAKYFDCEKPHTRYDTIKRIAKFLSPENKNAGELTIVKVLLAMQYARDYMFLSPTTHTCGIKAYYHRDPEAKSIFEKIEGTFRAKYTPDPKKKLGTKFQVKGTFTFKHGGVEPQTRTVDMSGLVLFSGLEKRDTKFRFTGKDMSTGKKGVLCFESSVQLKKAVDIFGYEGENEPSFERRMTIKWGPDTGSKDCPEDRYIKTVRKARRSQEQVEESQSDRWPFKECREQKRSGNWPGAITPPTHECLRASIDQTYLRESNITIEYQVDVEARNRWKRPAVAAAAFLLPYWDTERSTAAAHAHSSHVASSAGGEFVQGKIEIDVSARKENPTMDIHWHASHGEEHFHNVDLGALPRPMKVLPVFSRFSPYINEMFKMGAFGYCAGSPSSVITFDNFTYNAGLTECPTLLAGDCDDKPRFALLARKISGDRIGLTVHLGDHKLEMEDLNTVKVDGKAVPLSDTVYTDNDEEKLFKIVKVSSTYAGILSDKLSLYIGYSGAWVTVTAGSRYRATACGLCGNFDSNPYNDFTGPDNACKGMGAEEMIKAYTVRDGGCAGVGSPCPV